MSTLKFVPKSRNSKLHLTLEKKIKSSAKAKRKT